MAQRKSSGGKKRSSGKAGPRTGQLERQVDAVLRTHGLALDEEPEELLAKADRRESKFKPGNAGGRRRAKKATKGSTSAATKKAAAKPQARTRQAAKKKAGKRSSPAKKRAPKRKSAKKSAKRKKKAPKRKKSGKSSLTPKQRAQRKYAAQMRVIRQRAAESPGGSGPIAERDAAKKLRKDLGIKRST
jgi:hypothetical protein